MEDSLDLFILPLRADFLLYSSSFGDLTFLEVEINRGMVFKRGGPGDCTIVRYRNYGERGSSSFIYGCARLV